MMPAGKRDKRITIEREVTVKGARGGTTKTWAQFALAWAEMRHVSGVESDATAKYGGLVPVARTKFTIPPRSDLDTTMRVNFRGVYYGIVDVDDTSRKETILTCETGARDGA
jgi:SPP1 family predicted phage head-tail adaptor